MTCPSNQSSSGFQNFGPEENDREGGDLSGLGQGQRFKYFIEGPEPARHHHEALGVLQEHHFPSEEVAKVDPEGDVFVERLLKGEFDAEADRHAAGLECSLVRSLHDAGAASGEGCEAGLCQSAPDAGGRLIHRRFAPGPGRTEDANAWTDLGQRSKALDELRLDPQDAPRVRMDPIVLEATGEQALIGRLSVLLVASSWLVCVIYHPSNLRRRGRSEAPPPAIPALVFGWTDH